MLTTVLFRVTVGAWALLELSLRVRERAQGRGGTEHDRGTRILLGVLIGTAGLLAARAATDAPSLRIGGQARTIGLIIVWLGLAIRVWSVAALGRAFRTTVEVDAGQAVISRGPYRWVRHPSYTGLLLMFTGVGLAVDNWLALAALMILPALALLRRIRVEEAELTRVLGDSYREYQLRTKRLVPGVW